MDAAKSILKGCAIAACLLGLCGCATTLTYNKPLPLAQQLPRVTNPDPLPTSLAVTTPTVEGNHIIYQVKGNRDLSTFVSLNKTELARNFRTTLYRSLCQSRLYQHIIQEEHPASVGHMLETRIHLPAVDANDGSVWADHSTTVGVDYLVRSSTGTILSSGRISETGHFDQGYPGFSRQEKLRFVVEPVLQALGKVCARLPEVLLDDLSKVPVVGPNEVGSSIKLPPRTWQPGNIAVADLTAYTLSQGEAKTLTEKVHSTLVQTDYFTVLSRSDMKTVLEAQQFQRTGACDDTSCLVEMGKILSVQKIVGGTLGKVGATFSISLRLVDVETGKTEFTVDDEWKGEADAFLEFVQDTTKRLAAEYAQRKIKQ